MANFIKVEEAVSQAKGIAWDTCHKIYVLMDGQQVSKMREYGYETLFTSDDLEPNQMLSLIKDWYEDSCGLRFVSAVETNETDPNAGFTDLISQFEDEDEDEEEEEIQDED
jgi:hypothetical protein